MNSLCHDGRLIWGGGSCWSGAGRDFEGKAVGGGLLGSIRIIVILLYLVAVVDGELVFLVGWEGQGFVVEGLRLEGGEESGERAPETLTEGGHQYELRVVVVGVGRGWCGHERGCSDKGWRGWLVVKTRAEW